MDIENVISSEGFYVDEDTDDSLSLKCDSSKHSQHNRIREGNDAYIIVSINGDWQIEETICSECSVRTEVDKYSTKEDTSVAVVQATAMYDLSDKKVKFSGAKVWEYIE